jgi:hypothetical protein
MVQAKRRSRALLGAASVVAVGALAVSAHAAPVNETRPSVQGSLVHGTFATCNPGTWSVPAELEYQWYRGVVRADTRIDGQTGPRLRLDRPAHAPTIACGVVAVDGAGARSRTAFSDERKTTLGRTTVRITRVVPLPGIVRIPSPPFRLQRARVEGVVGPPVFLNWQREAFRSRNPQLGSMFISRGRVSILPRGTSTATVRNPQGRFRQIVHLPAGRSTIRVTFGPSSSDWRSSRATRTVVIPAR